MTPREIAVAFWCALTGSTADGFPDGRLAYELDQTAEQVIASLQSVDERLDSATKKRFEAKSNLRRCEIELENAKHAFHAAYNAETEAMQAKEQQCQPT